MITLWRIFVASWKNLFRNGWIALATVFVFMMALLSVNVLLSLHTVLGRVTTMLEERIDVTIGFKDQTPDAVVKQARFYLMTLPQVREIEEATPEQVLARFRERHKYDEKILGALEELQANPHGAQLVLRARSLEDYLFLMQAIQNPQYAEFIESQTYDDHQTAIQSVQIIGDKVRMIGAGLVALFALFGLLIAFNAIRVAIYTQREEIAIMRLVGASAFYIRTPFILGGVWLALFAVVLTAATVIGSVIWLEPTLSPMFGGISMGLREFFLAQGVRVVMVEAIILSTLAALVSWVAVGKYIRR